MLAAIENIDHRTYRRFTFVLLFPVFRFRNVLRSQRAKRDGTMPMKKSARQPQTAPPDYKPARRRRRQPKPEIEIHSPCSASVSASFNNIGGAGAIFSRHAHPNNQPGNKERCSQGQNRRPAYPTKKNNAGHHRRAATVAIPLPRASSRQTSEIKAAEIRLAACTVVNQIPLNLQ